MSELCMGSYERHYYRLGSVIRETVKEAQKMLCDIEMCHIRHLLTDYYSEPRGITPPKSLGELCIEVAQETLSEGVSLNPTPLGGKVAYVEWTQMTERFPDLEVEMSISRRDIQELREKMYRKHTDVGRELKRQRCERLIDLVRDDLGDWITR